MIPVRAPLGLYLHIPFCQSICAYCNFTRGLHDESLRRRYVQALAREIRDWPGTGRAADTIYFGGGTPSLLESAEVAALIDVCRAGFACSPDMEITLETNPETVDAARLARFRAVGVNRLSIGVQSFRDDELARLDRRHSAARAALAIGWARAAGFDNVSLDLMSWLPGQRLSHWMESVARAISLDPDHVSMYLLELYPNSPLREKMARDGGSLAADDEAADMFEQGVAAFQAAGYEHYELSNLARPWRRSRHNLKYWTDGDWVGFGCGAHSTVDGVRWRNTTSTEDYVERIAAGVDAAVERRRLTREERLQEALFMGLRLSEGVDLRDISARYATDVSSRYGEALAPYVGAGLVVIEAERLRLTSKGQPLANEVMGVFV